MLSGFPPYLGRDVDEVLKNVRENKGMSFDYPEWEIVSPECIAFVKYLLTRDYKERPTASEALRHPYLQQWMTGAEETTEEGGEKYTFDGSIRHLHGHDENEERQPDQHEVTPIPTSSETISDDILTSRLERMAQLAPESRFTQHHHQHHHRRHRHRNRDQKE